MIFAANWKMHKNPIEAREFISVLKERRAEREGRGEVVIFATPLLAQSVSEAIGQEPHLSWGGQNAHWQAQGAYTGETSPLTLKEMGAAYCLVGHSERRQLFRETDADLAKKILAIQSVGLTPVLCVGETLPQRDSGQTEAVLENQLRLALEYAQFQSPFWIAYEPVWAIGSGRVATPDMVESVHQYIRRWLKDLNPDLHSTPILYGGSVKPENAGELCRVPGVDGFLIGGASLKVDDLLAIVRASRK